jgi:hypothetical protein
MFTSARENIVVSMSVIGQTNHLIVPMFDHVLHLKFRVPLKS